MVSQYLEDNLGAFNFKLSPNDVAELRKIAENATLGDRYAPIGMASVLLDTPPLN